MIVVKGTENVGDAKTQVNYTSTPHLPQRLSAPAPKQFDELNFATAYRLGEQNRFKFKSLRQMHYCDDYRDYCDRNSNEVRRNKLPRIVATTSSYIFEERHAMGNGVKPVLPIDPTTTDRKAFNQWAWRTALRSWSFCCRLIAD